MFSPTARRSGLMDRSTLGPNEEKGAILFGSIATGASANDRVACTGLVASCLMVRPSWLLTISAGSVASPTAMTTASGLNGYVYVPGQAELCAASRGRRRAGVHVSIKPRRRRHGCRRRYASGDTGYGSV